MLSIFSFSPYANAASSRMRKLTTAARLTDRRTRAPSMADVTAAFIVGSSVVMPPTGA